MHVIGINDAGTLGDSTLTPATLGDVRNPRISAFVAADLEDVRILQCRFNSELASFLLVNDEGLSELREHDFTITPLGQVDDTEMFRRHRTPRGVRGWLLFFCLLLIVVFPATVVYQVRGTVDLVRQGVWTEPPLVGRILQVASVGLAAFSFTAGLLLLQKHRSAVTVAKVFLVAVTGNAIALYLWNVTAHWSTLPYDSVIDLAAAILVRPLVFTFVWYVYLANSKRVRNTYPSAHRKKLQTHQQ
ncbi:MAG TPA: DUF2569 family protein [Candidatus Dormibacteraeota bacterium]|jgi:hypothetical protein|nr:DUF2569 family protein [Candidatus Dormibacteraeota bacterium]